jgi:hypothetical protein
MKKPLEKTSDLRFRVSKKGRKKYLCGLENESIGSESAKV